MPYISRLKVNQRHRQARRDLAWPYDLHRTLWRAFPNGEPGRVLFRVDTDRRDCRSVVLIQSEFEPEWSRLPADDYLLDPPECKPFDLPVTAGQRLRFRLRANPTKKVGTASKADRLAGKKGNGQRLALLREVDQVAWLLEKAGDGGFRIPGEWVEDKDGRKIPNFRVDVISEGWVWCGKEGYSDGRFYAVRFDGVLEVTDAEKFQQTVASGIGPAKAFGFGLLSLAPARG